MTKINSFIVKWILPLIAIITFAFLIKDEALKILDGFISQSDTRFLAIDINIPEQNLYQRLGTADYQDKLSERSALIYIGDEFDFLAIEKNGIIVANGLVGKQRAGHTAKPLPDNGLGKFDPRCDAQRQSQCFEPAENSLPYKQCPPIKFNDDGEKIIYAAPSNSAEKDLLEKFYKGDMQNYLLGQSNSLEGRVMLACEFGGGSDFIIWVFEQHTGWQLCEHSINLDACNKKYEHVPNSIELIAVYHGKDDVNHDSKTLAAFNLDTAFELLGLVEIP